MRIDKLKQAFFTQVLEFGADVLALHAEVLRDLLNAPGSVRRQIYLRPAAATAEDLHDLSKVPVSLRPERESVRLLDRIHLTLNLREAIQNLLVPIPRLLS
jgi:hypothetical protein